MSRTYQYCAVADIRAMHSKLTSAVAADSVLTTWIDAACDLIDSRVYSLYTVPFTTTPLVIKEIACFAALYNILKIVYSGATPEQTSWLETYNKRAEEMLSAVESGKTPLIDSTGAAINSRGGAGLKTNLSPYKPIFNEGNPREWEVSEKKIADEAAQYGE